MKKNYLQLMALVLIMFLHLSVAQSADLKNGVTHLSQTEFVEKAQQEGAVVIDVRTEREFKQGHIEGSINLSHDDIIENISLLDPYKGKDLVFYCHSGVRVKVLTDYLREVAFTDDKHLFHLKGDIRAWRSRGRSLVK